MKQLRMLALSLALVGAAVSVKAQTLDEVVSKHISALGGADKLKSLKSQVMEGKMHLQGMELPFKSIIIQNKGMRVEFEVMGTKNIQVATTTGGWNFLPVQQQTEPVDANPDDIKDISQEVDLAGELFDYKTKGSTAELIGKETIEGQELYKIKLTRKDASVSSYYLDAKTYYIAKRVSPKTIQGQEVEITENLTDYKKTSDGFVYASQVEQQPMGIKMSFEKVQYNGPVDEKVFEKPAKK